MSLYRNKDAADLYDHLCEEDGDAAARWVDHFVATGKMTNVFPELLPLTTTIAVGHKDIYRHTLQVVAATRPYIILRIAALLHDIGKPATRRFTSQGPTFHGHEAVGARMVRRITQRLDFPDDLAASTINLVALHMRANQFDGTYSDSGVRRLMREAGSDLPWLLELSRADITTGNARKRNAALAGVDELERRIAEIKAEEAHNAIGSPLDGNDLCAIFAQPPGPWIRPIKDKLIEMVRLGTLKPDDRDGAVEKAMEMFYGNNR